MRIIILAALALCSISALCGQKIGQKVKNQLFLQALLQECPQCVDERWRLTEAAAELDSLSLDFSKYSSGAFESSFVSYNPALNPISFQDFAQLKSLVLHNPSNGLLRIAAWPPHLEQLNLEGSRFAAPMPLLPAGLKALNISEYYSIEASKAEFEKSQFLSLPLPQGLESLEANNLKLDKIPTALPASLQKLSLNGNQINKIENLPPNLRHLSLNKNKISEWPQQWPNSLKELQLSDNPLIELPQNWGNCQLESLDLNRMKTHLRNGKNSLKLSLPTSLKALSLAGCYLAELSGELPAGLELLNLDFNRLEQLPSLPKSLRYLYLSNNRMDSLSVGGLELVDLSISKNELVYLDTLPASLVNFSCNKNQLHSLPSLPAGLKTLRCESNQLSVLPALPAGIEELHFYGNPLSSQPDVPKGLKATNKSNSSFKKTE